VAPCACHCSLLGRSHHRAGSPRLAFHHRSEHRDLEAVVIAPGFGAQLFKLAGLRCEDFRSGCKRRPAVTDRDCVAQRPIARRTGSSWARASVWCRSTIQSFSPRRSPRSTFVRLTLYLRYRCRTSAVEDATLLSNRPGASSFKVSPKEKDQTRPLCAEKNYEYAKKPQRYAAKESTLQNREGIPSDRSSKSPKFRQVSTRLIDSAMAPSLRSKAPIGLGWEGRSRRGFS
jgi:hypothetical protein